MAMSQHAGSINAQQREQPIHPRGRTRSRTRSRAHSRAHLDELVTDGLRLDYSDEYAP